MYMVFIILFYEFLSRYLKVSYMKCKLSSYFYARNLKNKKYCQILLKNSKINNDTN